MIVKRPQVLSELYLASTFQGNRALCYSTVIHKLYDICIPLWCVRTRASHEMVFILLQLHAGASITVLVTYTPCVVCTQLWYSIKNVNIWFRWFFTHCYNFSGDFTEPLFKVRSWLGDYVPLFWMAVISKLCLYHDAGLIVFILLHMTTETLLLYASYVFLQK